MVLRRLTSNFVSFAGLLLAFISAIIIVFILVASLLGLETNPYLGVVAFLVLPAFLILGLILIPVGQAWERRRRARAAGRPAGLIRLEIDLDNTRTRRRILSLAGVTTLAMALLAATSYEGVRFMDTPTFCGEVCHKVMQPELTSYRNGPHARVPCVECHIGEGANWYVKSKLSGLGQVVAVTLNTYERPIPVPVKNLRPARETCEHCHWPEKFHSYKLVVKNHFQEDEPNTLLKTVLLVKTGGGSAAAGGTEGIHWHMNIANRIEYVALDAKRDTIPYVRMTDPQGVVTEFVADGSPLKLDQLREMSRRRMDCMDCHNRPSHVFDVPEVAVDDAMASGKISRDLPYIRREGKRVLTLDYPSRDAAVAGIRDGLHEFYQKEYPTLYSSRHEDIDRAADELATIYRRNVFPDMKISWGTYKSYIGHTYANGCFRCHDSAHTSPDGRQIKQECDSCHTLLAMDEADPKPVLEQLPTR